MQEMGLGPNGGLVFCMQYLSDNIVGEDVSRGRFSDTRVLRQRERQQRQLPATAILQ